MKTPIITCPSFSEQSGIAHGFFTRNGGVSEGIYSSLNLGMGSKDNKDNVLANRKIAVDAFGAHNNIVDILESDDLHTLNQTHSSKVNLVFDKFKDRVEADALVTNKPNVLLGILTADCTPVLFADSKNHVVGAAHAGWKGACSGILENTIIEMEKLGAVRDGIKAVIGPTIAQKSYEVGGEFRERFLGFSNDNKCFFIPSVKEGHFMFNLPSYVEDRLKKAGIEAVTNVNRDTCAEEDSFFSYRRSCLKNEPDYGRNLSVVALG